MRSLSPTGAAFIAQFEGFDATPYNDPWNCTVGYGHLIHYGVCSQADFQRWGQLSRGQALALLQQDARVAIAAVEQAVKVPLNQAQFDALVSLAFNCGAGAVFDVARFLNAHDVAGAAAEWLRWCHGNGGVVMAGLVRRRQAEVWMFTHGNTPDVQPAAPKDPLWYLEPDEHQWVTRWNGLRGHRSLAAHRERQKLYDLMTRRRKTIWARAQQGGWHIQNRALRYAALKRYTAGSRHK